MGVTSDLEAARLQLLEDRAAEARRRRLALLIFASASTALAIGLGLYFLPDPNIPTAITVATFILAAGELATVVLTFRGHQYLAGVLSQLLPIPFILFAGSAFSVDAGFGSYLFIGALGVMVVIPEGHNKARFLCVGALVLGIVIGQVFFASRHAAWAPLSYEQTSTLNSFNRTVMTVGLFALALELTRALRASRKLVEESLRIAEFAATTDPLTGLANRRPVWRKLEAAADSGEVLTIAIADMDYFKALNDAFGHDCGDEALRHVAGVLSDSLRSEDLVARWGGEEFVLIVHQPMEKALPILERARSRVAQTAVPCSVERHQITISIGAAEMADSSPESTISAADEALYRAKQAGRNQVSL